MQAEYDPEEQMWAATDDICPGVRVLAPYRIRSNREHGTAQVREAG